MILDCCLFAGEESMLTLRMLTLQHVVDRFVIVAASRTHQGQPLDRRPIVEAFERARTATRIPVGLYWCEPEMVLVKRGITMERAPGERGPAGSPFFMHIERQHRNHVRTVVQSICQDPQAVVMVSDVDEIPHPGVVRKFGEVWPQHTTPRRPAFVCEQRFHSGALDILHPYQPWLGTVISRLADLAPQIQRDERTTVGMGRQQTINTISDAGIHASWMGTDSERRHKLDTFSHAEIRGRWDPEEGRRALMHPNNEQLRRVTLAESYEFWWPAPLLDGTFKIPDAWLSEDAWQA